MVKVFDAASPIVVITGARVDLSPIMTAAALPSVQNKVDYDPLFNLRALSNR